MKQKNNIWVTFLAIIITAIIFSGSTYAWQSYKINKIKHSDNNRISDLEQKLSVLQTKLEDAAKSSNTIKNEVAKDSTNFEPIQYDKEITISGSYELSGPRTMPILEGTLCFFVDKETEYLLPAESGQSPNSWFCFKNQTEAKKMFKVTECAEGKATIIISNYRLIIGPGRGAYDTADLKKIISKEEFSTECK